MPTLTLTVGLPGCGKSTWAVEEVKKSRSKTVIVNMDDIRQTMSGSHSNYKFNKINEQYVQSVQCSAADHAVSNNWNIIVADTNLNPTTVLKWKAYAKAYGYTFKLHDFFNEFMRGKEYVHTFFALKDYLKQCKEWNLNRTKSVPESVIDDMADKYLYSKFVNIEAQDTKLEEAIIVDIDGTLAHMKDYRSPYDESNVHLDDPDPEVILSVLAEKNYLGRKVIIMSGRHETCMSSTIEWLNKYKVPFDEIYMRGANDNRSDDIVKYELYNNNVKGRYNVVKVFDDRQQVTLMWRRLLGLKVFQVDFGNF